jgi:GH25 family lysozyme M1 (1,4-beta-N-acetylmuramidase)
MGGERGLDGSSFQYRIDWDKVPLSIVFAYFRMFDWRADRVDDQVGRNVLFASERRVVGGYHRADPVRRSPAQEAAVFVALLRALGLDCPGRLIPAIDIEPTDDPAGNKRVDWPKWTREFFTYYRALTSSPLPLVVYSSGSYFDTLLGGTADWPAWVSTWVGHSERYAKPAGTPAEQWAGKTWYQPARTLVHQYTTTGLLSGITYPDGRARETDLDAIMPNRSLADAMIRPAA